MNPSTSIRTARNVNARFLQSRVLFQRKWGLSRRLTVMYGPVPHVEIDDVEFEPRMFQVTWRASCDDAWPIGFAQECLIREEDEKSDFRFLVWVTPSAQVATDMVKKMFNFTIDLPVMHS